MHSWYWHPILVHFSAGLLVASLAFLVLAKTIRNTKWFRYNKWVVRIEAAGIWSFWSGILVAAITVLTGLLAYITVPNVTVETGNSINNRVAMATATAAMYIMLAIWQWIRGKEGKAFTNHAWLGVLTVATVLLCITVYSDTKLADNNTENKTILTSIYQINYTHANLTN